MQTYTQGTPEFKRELEALFSEEPEQEERETTPRTSEEWKKSLQDLMNSVWDKIRPEDHLKATFSTAV